MGKVRPDKPQEVMDAPDWRSPLTGRTKSETLQARIEFNQRVALVSKQVHEQRELNEDE